MTQINAEKIRERLVAPMPNDKLVGWLGVLFIVAAFAFLLINRDKVREKYADWVTTQSESNQELGGKACVRLASVASSR